MKKTFNLGLKTLLTFLVTFVSLNLSFIQNVNALSNLSGTDVLNAARQYENWTYNQVGTCTGLVTRTLNDLGIASSVVGTMVGEIPRFSPEDMLANAKAHPDDAKLIYEGSPLGAVSAGVKDGDLVIATAEDMNSTFGHVAFIEFQSGTLGWYGANNEVLNIGWLPLIYNRTTRGNPGTRVTNIHVFRLVDDTPLATLKIAKKNEDNQYLPNTSFKVSYNSDMSDSLGTYKTGSDGTVTISDLNAQSRVHCYFF